MRSVTTRRIGARKSTAKKQPAGKIRGLKVPGRGLKVPGQCAVPRITRGVREDRNLVDHCLAGEPGAWTCLYQACHEKLLTAIRRFLRDATGDINLVDEIAARVWYTVVRNKGELLSRFDVARGCRLSTFLAVIAKNEVRTHFRAEHRRKAREQTASRSEACVQPAHLQNADASETEFRETLTPKERVYYETVLIATSLGKAEEDYTAENSWQLRRRVRKKLHLFLGMDD